MSVPTARPVPTSGSMSEGSAPAPLNRKEARASCDEQVATTLRPMLLVTAGLLVIFTIIEPFLTPYPENLPIAIAMGALAVAFFAAHAALAPGRSMRRHVHALFAALVIAAWSSIVLTFLVTPDPVLTSGVVLLILGAGILVLSWSWLLAILAVTAGGWMGILLASGGDDWQQIIFTISAAAMLSAAAHAARLRTHLNLEALRRHDTAQRRELEEGLHALREAEQRLRSVVRAAPVILFATDASGCVTVAEGRGLTARGWDKVELVGKPARELLAPLPEEVAHMEGALQGEASSGVSERDGRVFETIWTPVYAPSGSIDGAICVATDVTDRVRADASARDAADRAAAIAHLQEMDRFKTRILNTASHELNTPLTPIKLQMHLLKADLSSMGSKQQRAVSVLDRNVDRLASLVSDIMDVARLQEGQLRMTPTTVRLDEIVREAAASYEAVAESKGVALQVDLRPGPEAHGDPRRLLQVLFNLIGNAIKFTPADGRVTLESRPENGEMLVLVRDTGSGMTEEQMSRLFRPFSQVHDPKQSDFGGTGLGLYISRGIAEQHGGTLTCASAGPGQGSTFTLRLPTRARPAAGS